VRAWERGQGKIKNFILGSQAGKKADALFTFPVSTATVGKRGSSTWVALKKGIIGEDLRVAKNIRWSQNAGASLESEERQLRLGILGTAASPEKLATAGSSRRGRNER